MKNKYLILVLITLLLKVTTGNCTVHTITTTLTPNPAFVPTSVNAVVGDSIHFLLVYTFHSAVEVSEATWDANEITPIIGFDVPFGVIDTFIIVNTAKTYYFICQQHGPVYGMKGTIVVSNPTGVESIAAPSSEMKIFPSPATSNITIQTNMLTGKENQVSILDITGKILYRQENVSNEQAINVSQFSPGIYILSLQSDNLLMEKKLIISR